jgi:hypothetical protein
MTSPSEPVGEQQPDVVTAAPGGGSRRPLRRPFLIGFVVGFLITLPAVFLGLLVPAAEKVMPFVTPGRLLLRPLTAWIEVWPGAVNMLIVSVANGLVFGVAVACVVLVFRRIRSRRR